MDLNFKLNTDFSLKSEKVLPLIANFWRKSRLIVFATVLLAVTIWGVYIWRSSLNSSGWDQQRKQEYLKSQEKNVTFREADFTKATVDVLARQKYVSDTNGKFKDIFAEYK